MANFLIILAHSRRLLKKQKSIALCLCLFFFFCSCSEDNYTLNPPTGEPSRFSPSTCPCKHFRILESKDLTIALISFLGFLENHTLKKADKPSYSFPTDPPNFLTETYQKKHSTLPEGSAAAILFQLNHKAIFFDTTLSQLAADGYIGLAYDYSSLLSQGQYRLKADIGIIHRTDNQLLFHLIINDAALYKFETLYSFTLDATLTIGHKRLYCKGSINGSPQELTLGIEETFSEDLSFQHSEFAKKISSICHE